MAPKSAQSTARQLSFVEGMNQNRRQTHPEESDASVPPKLERDLTQIEIDSLADHEILLRRKRGHSRHPLSASEVFGKYFPDDYPTGPKD